MKTYIRNGYVIDPASGFQGQADILIRDGRIVKMAEGLCANVPFVDLAAAQLIDASGLIIAPGLIDVHSHFREPGFTYKEDIESGS